MLRETKHGLATCVCVHSGAVALRGRCAGWRQGADRDRRTWPSWRMGTARHIKLRAVARRRVHAHQRLARNRGRFARLFHHGGSEWDTDLIFKKPFTLSDKVEFMVGVGPQWTYSREGTQTGAEFALDFMFWPTPDRKFGWFIEPAYNYSFSRGHEQSLSTTVGLLIPIE